MSYDKVKALVFDCLVPKVGDVFRHELGSISYSVVIIDVKEHRVFGRTKEWLGAPRRVWEFKYWWWTLNDGVLKQV